MRNENSSVSCGFPAQGACNAESITWYVTACNDYDEIQCKLANPDFINDYLCDLDQQ